MSSTEDNKTYSLAVSRSDTRWTYSSVQTGKIHTYFHLILILNSNHYFANEKNDSFFFLSFHFFLKLKVKCIRHHLFFRKASLYKKNLDRVITMFPLRKFHSMALNRSISNRLLSSLMDNINVYQTVDI